MRSFLGQAIGASVGAVLGTFLFPGTGTSAGVTLGLLVARQFRGSSSAGVTSIDGQFRGSSPNDGVVGSLSSDGDADTAVDLVNSLFG